MYRWPGVQKPLDQYGPDSSAKPPAAAKQEADDDDDFDLFGSEVSIVFSMLQCMQKINRVSKLLYKFALESHMPRV